MGELRGQSDSSWVTFVGGGGVGTSMLAHEVQSIVAGADRRRGVGESFWIALPSLDGSEVAYVRPDAIAAVTPTERIMDDDDG